MAAVTLDQKITEFIPKAITRVRVLSQELIDVYQYNSYQSDRGDELLMMISETNDFIRLLQQEGMGGLTEKEASDLIDFFYKWLVLNKVLAASYQNYQIPIQENVVVPNGTYALAVDLAAEIAARMAADAALDARVTILENDGVDPGTIFPPAFFDNYLTTYAVIFDDDVRLHTHSNLALLEQINATDITNIKALQAHYLSVGDPGGLHVSQADRDLWNAGGGGSGTTQVKHTSFTGDGVASTFLITNGTANQLLFVAVNGSIQTLGTHVNLVGNTVDFGTPVATGWRIDVTYAEGLSLGGGGGDDIYDLSSPSTVDVGGMPAGTAMSGRKLKAILEEIAVDYLLPAFSAYAITDLPTLFEVGTVINGFRTHTWNITHPGNVQPNSVAIRDVTANVLIGSGLANDGSEVLDIGTIANTVPISRAWRAEALNTNAGAIQSAQRTLASIYPYFFGKVASGGAAPGASRPASNQALINSGTKVVALSTGDLSVLFNSTSDDYIWFAIPSSSASKLSWFVDALNTGAIGGSVGAGGNLFPAPVTVAINSPTALWSAVNYKIYVSNYQTAVAVAMQLRNS